MKRAAALLLVVACAAGVVAYQATRPARAPAGPRVFVPSPTFFLDFSPSFRTSIADAYYLYTIQYYGEHLKVDGRLDALPAMLDLVTTLSPHFTRAYVFGAFALIDAGRPELGYRLLERGFAENPEEWRFPAYLGFFAYAFGRGLEKDKVAAEWYARAVAVPGSPPYLSSMAAALAARGGETNKAVLLWGQVYADGDKYAREKAVLGLDRLLPSDRAARLRALAPLNETMSPEALEALVGELLEGYGT